MTGLAGLSALSGCATPSQYAGPADGNGALSTLQTPEQRYRWLNRVSWGATSSSERELERAGPGAWLRQQLQADPKAPMPYGVQASIDAMTISQLALDPLALRMEAQRKAADDLRDDEAKKTAQRAYQDELTRLSRESAQRHLLRALYSPHQVLEQMAWFWFNHFSVHLYKHNVRALIPDYEATLRQHALGRFSDLLTAASLHPAMLRYLDNEQNAVGKINENQAREMLELHALGVDAGYTQQDVQELARVLTGVGVTFRGEDAKVRPELQRYYVRQGLFEFHPGRHDFQPKTLLGQRIEGGGLGEVTSAIKLIAGQASAASFVSQKLAKFWLADEPPASLVQRMVAMWKQTDGDIARVLHTLFTAPEFVQAPGTKFKDPVRYVVSAVRLAYDDKPVLNVNPMINWINRMGEPLYGRVTPDGYPLVASGWDSAGQLATRFEIAKAIGSGSAGLFKTDGPQPTERAAFPQLANALYYRVLQGTLTTSTRTALEQATSPQEWNTLLLASPEFMVR
ncbi:DUF1800 domain-containing protein [Curvibacter sp. CHRR-16]|nr:DUF1800 domain-containing protein [Curvibacter sp. CHRR-16]